MKREQKDIMIKMEKILYYVKNNVNENLTLKQVAEKIGHSQRYFDKIFREYFELPFRKYYAKLKMREIAVQVLYPKNRFERTELEFFGYANAASFSKAFRKEFGVCPTTFQKEHRPIPYMPVRKKLFGTPIDLKYVWTEDMTVIGYPSYMEGEEECTDIIEYLIETSAYVFDHPSENVDLDEPGEHYGFCWHDEELDYGLYYIYTSNSSEKEESKNNYVKVKIPGMYYAVFSCKRPKTHEETANLSRLLMRYIRKEWKMVNDVKQNQMGWIYQKFDEEKIYVYFPMIPENAVIENEKQYGIEQWTKYIDEHISEELTAKKLSKIFYYSERSFRDIFKLYYGITAKDYISLRKGNKSFESVDLLQYYHEYKRTLKITFEKIRKLTVIAKVINTEEEANIPEMVEFWFRNDFESIKRTDYACKKTGIENKAALWNEFIDENTGEKKYEYVLGPVVRSLKQLPKDMKVFSLVGGKYAVFQTENPSDEKQMAEIFRMMTRCAFLGWVKENMVRIDWQRKTFVRYYHQKLYFYIPIID